MPAQTQLLNVRRGSHEIALDLSATQAQALDGNARLRVTRQPSPWTFYVFTHDDPKVSPVTSNKRFQQAVRYALDPEALLALAGPGAIRAPGIIASTIPGALPRKDAVKHDLARARADLAASGVGAQEVTLEYPSDETINGVPFSALAQKVQAQLRAAGFDVTLAGSPVATFQPKFRAGRVAFGLWVYAPSYPDPADYSPFMPGRLIADHFGWRMASDLPIEKLAAKVLVTTKPAARSALYEQIQRQMNLRSPLIPLIQPSQVFVTTSDITGAVFSGAYGVDVTRVSPR